MGAPMERPTIFPLAIALLCLTSSGSAQGQEYAQLLRPSQRPAISPITVPVSLQDREFCARCPAQDIRGQYHKCIVKAFSVEEGKVTCGSLWPNCHITNYKANACRPRGASDQKEIEKAAPPPPKAKEILKPAPPPQPPTPPVPPAAQKLIKPF